MNMDAIKLEKSREIKMSSIKLKKCIFLKAS